MLAAAARAFRANDPDENGFIPRYRLKHVLDALAASPAQETGA